MDREDIYSIIAYLRTLPAIQNDVPETKLDFPVNFLVNTMPVKASFTLKPRSTNTVAYGGYVANAAGCVDCHSKFTGKGEMVAGSAFGGGRQFNFPGGLVTAHNISPDKQLGIGSWTKEQFINRFKMFTDSAWKSAKLSATDFNTPMPWSMYAGMSAQDLSALFDFLQSQKPMANKVNKWVANTEPQAFLLCK